MRAFVAIDIPKSDAKDRIMALQKQISATGADLKMVEAENLHFTIKFLGDISVAQAEDASRRLRGLKLSGGTVEVRGVGAFPSPSRPRVIWVGVADDDEIKVRQVAVPVIEALEGLGKSDDRPFQAHATLSRLRPGRPAGALSSLLLSNESTSFGVIGLSSFKLKSSALTPNGPSYNDIEVFALT